MAIEVMSDASRSVIGEYRVMLQIVASLMIVNHDPNMLVV